MCRLCSREVRAVMIGTVTLGTSTGQYAAEVPESVVSSLLLRSTRSMLLWMVTSGWKQTLLPP